MNHPHKIVQSISVKMSMISSRCRTIIRTSRNNSERKSMCQINNNNMFPIISYCSQP